MKLSGFIRAVVVCVIAVLIASVLIYYVFTFSKWNMGVASLMRLNLVVKKIDLWPFGLSVLLVIVVSILKREPVSWSLTAVAPWIRMLWTCGFVVCLAVFIVSSLTGETVSVRSQGTSAEALLQGKWEAVSQEQLEKIVQQNTRERLDFVVFGLVVWMGIVGGTCEADVPRNG